MFFSLFFSHKMYCTLHVIEHAKRSWILSSYKMNSQSVWNQTNTMKRIFVNYSISIMSFQIFNYKIWEICCWCFSFSSTTSSWFACQKINKIEKMKCVFFLWYRHHSNHKFPPRNSIFFVDLFSVLNTHTHTRQINEQKKKWFIMAVFVCRYHSIDEKRVQYLTLLSL